MKQWWHKFRTWVASLFLPENLAKAVTLIQSIHHILDIAAEIVVAIDGTLKPMLADGENKQWCLVDFLSGYTDDTREVMDTAKDLAALPRNDLLHNAAVFATEKKLGGRSVEVSLISLAVQLAYVLYKVFYKK